MIQNKTDLKLYILADRIMNGKPIRRSLSEWFIEDVLRGGGIISYLRAMRKYAYYKNSTKRKVSFKTIKKLYWGIVFNKLGVKFGFSIGCNSLGYGVVIPHYGTIVINGDARIGNFAVLHKCTCIAGNKQIGDYFYLSTGSQVIGDISI